MRCYLKNMIRNVEKEQISPKKKRKKHCKYERIGGSIKEGNKNRVKKNISFTT